MTKRIDPDAKICFSVRIKQGIRQQVEDLFAKSTVKRKSDFYEMLLLQGISGYKEAKNASSS
tara:strand:- start:104 stop:289 length:186 start_codon:yes stop_codon:yes gene_type:complete